MKLQADHAGRFLHLAQRGLDARGDGGIEEHGNTKSLGHQLMQERHPFGVYLPE
jgi:hypothetical protein